MGNQKGPEHTHSANCSHGHGHDHQGHEHVQGHHHHHHHASGNIGVAFFLNLGFAVVELVGGLATNSMAVLSDALHDFGDAMALGMAWWMERKSLQKNDPRFTYGYRRLSVASALITGLILFAGSITIVARCLPRLMNPEPVHADGMLALAFLGIAVNGFAFWRMARGNSLNEKMLRWHFIEDITGWIVVLIGAVVMLIADLPWLDPLLALCLSLWVLWNVGKNLRHSLAVFLQESPTHLQRGEAEAWMRTQNQVRDVHHAHIWSLDGQAHIMTVHVVIGPEATLTDAHKLKVELKKGLREKFGILEATIEFESLNEACVDPEHKNTVGEGGGHHHH